MTSPINLSAARDILLLYTTIMEFIFSPRWILLIVVVLVGIIFILHRINSRDTKPAPLFSFPSLSQNLISVGSISLSQPLSSFRSISYPLVSFPSLSLQPIRFRIQQSKKGLAEPDPDVESPPLTSKPDVNISDNFSYQDQHIYATRELPSIKTRLESADDDDDGSSGTLDETWNSIVATGNAKPVRLFTRSQREGYPKRKAKKSTKDNRKEKKKANESTSNESVERRAQSPSTEGTTDMSSEESTTLSDIPIWNRRNNLGFEKHESDLHHRTKRLGLRDRNAVSL